MFWFIIPIGVDYQARRYPIVTFTLMGINTLIYLFSLYCWINDKALYDWWMETFWLIPEKSVWFTYFTAMFVHAGFLHLLGNMIYLFLFGSCVEDTIGHWRFLAFYLISGVVSCLVYVAFTPDHFSSEIPMGGASGAISACMGGFVLLLHRAKIEFKWVFILFLRFFSGEFALPAWLVLSFWFLEDILGMLIGLRDVGTGGGGTAFGAHVGGFVMGMLAIALLKPWLRREAAREDEEEEELAGSTLTLESGMAAGLTPAYATARVVSEEPTLMVYDRGNQTGPYTLAQVCLMVSDNTVSGEAMYWHEGMTEWKTVRDIA